MRLLVPIRVSRDTEEGSSPEDQRDTALTYGDDHPGTKIIFTDVVDFDISGATSIRDRDGVKPWLQPDKINEWDAIGGPEMSRISRDMRDYLNFFYELIQERGKIVVDLSDGTDSSTLRGRQSLENRILEAQRYREFVGEKRAKKAQRLSDAGLWDGGRIPFGYRPIQRETVDDYGKPRKTWHLVKDDDGTAPIAERMVDYAFAGMSHVAIGKLLTAEDVTSPLGNGGAWQDSTVRRILVSPTLAGFVVKMEGSARNKNIQTIRRDRDGQPIRFTDEPIISETRWRDLQDELKSRSRNRGEPQARLMLWNVAFCRNCSQPCEDELPCAEHDVRLYGHHRAKHTSKGNRYSCRRCGLSISLDTLERYVQWRLLKEAGHKPLLTPTTIRGSNHSAEIIKLERRIERLRLELDAEYDDDLERAIRKAAARVTELIQGPHEPDRIKLQPVDPPMTVAEHWSSLPTSRDQNRYLRTAGTIFYVDKTGIEGQLGWMALDSYDVLYDDLRKMLRRLELRHIDTWDEIKEDQQS